MVVPQLLVSSHDSISLTAYVPLLLGLRPTRECGKATDALPGTTGILRGNDFTGLDAHMHANNYRQIVGPGSAKPSAHLQMVFLIPCLNCVCSTRMPFLQRQAHMNEMQCVHLAGTRIQCFTYTIPTLSQLCFNTIPKI